MQNIANLYLIPVTLGDNDNINRVIPSYNNELVRHLKHFFVEDLRSARRFIKKVDKNIDVDSITFYELNEHTQSGELNNVIALLLKNGHNVGLMSEAGVPCIADPGADIVATAQRINAAVIPLVGPSSIILSLMASGFSGQNFAFVGYLPVDNMRRKDKIKDLERRAAKEGQTQIFIETPYRNIKLLESLFEQCNNETKICICVDATLSTEWIVTRKVSEWKKMGVPDISKRLAIFLLSV